MPGAISVYKKQPPQRMRILIYCDSLTPAGGLERVVLTHAAYLQDKHDVTILTKSNDAGRFFYEFPSKTKYTTLNSNSLLSSRQPLFKRAFKALADLLAFAKALKHQARHFDLIYVPHIRNLLELRLANVPLKKVLVTEHGSYYAYNLIYKVFKLFLYPRCKAIFSPTVHDALIYRKLFCNSYHVPYALRIDIENSDAQERDKVILSVGRLTSDKRHYLLLKIWSRISAHFPEWKLYIVGAGELHDSLLGFINKKRLSSSVRIIPPVGDIGSYMLRSSILAVTSRYEGFSLVLIEAMHAGLPVISFDVHSGPAELISHGENGLLIKDKNLDQYAMCLSQLMRSDQYRSTLGKEGIEYSSQFMLPNNNKIFMNAFDSI